MDEDGAAVSAVQCSVIQYCPDNALPSQITETTEEALPGNGEIDCNSQNDNPPVNNLQLNCGSENKLLEINDKNSIIKSIKNDPVELEEGEIRHQTAIIIESDIKPEGNIAVSNLKQCLMREEKDDKTIFTGEKAVIAKQEVDIKTEETKVDTKENEKKEIDDDVHLEARGFKREAEAEPQEEVPKKGKQQKSAVLNGDIKNSTPPPLDDPEEEMIDSESDEEVVKPRKRGRCKKNPELIPTHLAPDIALGYRMLLKFLETPQFSGFLRPGHLNVPPGENPGSAHEEITCLNQIKKKFEENTYKRLADFVTDVRSMLSSVYTAPRNPVAVKRALRLEQVLEQRIAQLPNYLRPQCSLVLSPDEVSNSPKKIRINKGGGFVSLLLERADKIRAEKDREKRKVLAEERKHMKEEQDKDVQDWEKNVLLKEYEEEIKSMWELPQIGHFIHLCANILNIGDVSQYEVERMLLMPQCSETLDLLITALLSNSLVRAKLDRTPSMPYTIWSPQVRTRVNAWYRAYLREFGNAQKVFEEIGVEPEFWEVVGKEHSPLDYFYFHEIPLIQRVWILKTLCDVDFVRKKTVYDNMRQQLLEELQGSNLGVDRHGNRYIHFPQFGMTALRIYRQSTVLDEGITPSELAESQEGFEERKGEITLEKVFRDIWDVGSRNESTNKRGRKKKKKNQSVAIKVKIEPTAPKSLRLSARAKRKVYVDSTDSDCSDTDLATLKNKLYDNQNKPEKNFISLSVFRLPRDKVKPVSSKKSYYSRKLEREEAERLRLEEREANKDKLSADEDASESMDRRLEDDDDDDGKENFTVKNLENLKMVLKKGTEDTENDNATDGSVKEEDKFRYATPAHMLPDRNKFYCVVDSVDGLRQLISQFASDDNDLEIINRSTLRSGKKSGKSEPASPSCEVQLIERLQVLVEDLEAWEMDFIKTSRSIRDKLYKEYTSFTNRPVDFVHPNEAYWQKLYEEPAPVVPSVEPEPPPETPVMDLESSSTAPPSPLGGLRPRTRTRQQQQQQHFARVPEAEFDEELDEELESSESDDNWEMPSKKRRRSTVVLPTVTPRQSKRVTKKFNRNASPASDGDKAEKAKRALFWSPRSSDPSEELNWETNRQKILEKHNSPRKVLHGDIESDMCEVENALRTTSIPSLKNRIQPPPVPGNRKPYFSAAQLKAMNRKKDNDVEIIGHKSDIQIIQQKIGPKRPTGRATKSMGKKSAGTQSNEHVDGAKTGPTRLEGQPLTHEEYFITDGSVYIKIDYSSVPELIKNQEAVRKFGDRLDLNKKIQIVKKKVETVPPSTVIQNNSVMLNNALIQNKAPPPNMMGQEPNKMAGTGLRFIRPQNIPTQVQFLRPTQRIPTAQPNLIYVQTTQPQGYVQLPQGVRPSGIVQVLARPGVPGVMTLADKSVAGTGVQNYATFSQSKPEDTMVVNSNQVDIMGLLSSANAPNQVGFIQVQAGAKQPIQFVQVSQANAGVVQAATPGMAGQNIIHLSSTTPNNIGVQATPSYVRLASTGQIVQLATAQSSGGGTITFKPQLITGSSGTSTPHSGVVTQTSATNQVNLVQVQGLPGEPISYIPMPAGMKPVGNLVQIQSPLKTAGQLGTFMQVASPPRQQTPVGRLVQVQPSTRPQGVVLPHQSPRVPQGQVVQMQIQRPTGAGTMTSPRSQCNVVSSVQGIGAQNLNTPRPQTTVVQVYAAPRMQTTMVQMQGSPSPQTVQMRAPLQSPSQPMQQQISQRPLGSTVMVSMPSQQQNSPRPMVGSVSVPMQQQGNLRAIGPTAQGQAMLQSTTRPMMTTVGTQQQGNIRPMAAGAQTSQPMQTSPRPVMISMSQALQQQQQIGPRPMMTTVQMSQGMQQTQQHGTVLATSLQQGSSRPAMVQLSQASPRPVATAVPQERPAQRAMGSFIRLQSSPRPQTSGTTMRPQTPTLQYSNAARSVGQGMITQTIGVAGKQSSAHVLQVGSNPAKTMGTQVVQMPLSSGKPGLFQIQNAAGQPVSILQVVTSGQPTSGSNTLSGMTSMPSLVQVQGSNVGQMKSNQPNISQGNFIQMQPSSATTSSTGLVQFPGSNRPQLVQIQGTSPRPIGLRPVGSPSKQTAIYTIQIPKDQEEGGSRIGTSPISKRIVSSAGHTVRLVPADPKSGQSFALQPMLVRASGSKLPASTGNRVMGISQPVMIKIDEDDDEVKIVEETVAGPEAVDILHGELSARETPEGLRYSVKTTAGKDHVLTNSQVEARRAANNGRMF